MNRVADGLRVLIGILSSIVIYTAIMSNTFFAFSSSLINIEGESQVIADWFIRFIAIISGFSETFIADLISRASGNHETQNAKEQIEWENNKQETDQASPTN